MGMHLTDAPVDPGVSAASQEGRDERLILVLKRGLPALVRAMRPTQWVKNLLVFIAPVGAGLAAASAPLTNGLLVLVMFCAASSAVYLVNDTVDAPEDRQHPRKKYRPIASGALGARAALVAAGLLALVAIMIGGLLPDPVLLIVIGYVCLQVAYALGLKRVAVVEMAAVASGFVLRVIAGAAAVALTPSIWLLTVTASGALAIVSGKRLSESLAKHAGTTRQVLEEYSPDFLRAVLTIASTALVMSYTLWAFAAVVQVRPVLVQLSVVPLLVALMRYLMDAFNARTERPEGLISDRWLVGLGMIWLALVLFGTNF
ncbi:MAG: decaprenyl-phosphate phosphoribosyltransferase [Candidatus Nanopelagicales bacterium]|nr:decaprenyl-phosphate phosphoribosyltransferase [Candidatus Nanopelagicales bacterium]